MAIDSLRSTFRPAAAYWTAGARPAAAALPTAPARQADTLALTPRALPTGGSAPTFDDLEADATLAIPADEPTGGSGSAQPTLRPGANSTSVRTLQEKLQAAGYNVGAIDGDYGRHTEAAVRAFQRAKGLGVDGVVGTKTWAALGETGTGVSAPTGESGSLMSRLRSGLANRYRGVRHQCFRYAWATAAQAGLKGIGSAIQSRVGRGNGTAYLETMVRNGQVRVGDVIYVNKSPGADPSSSNLKYGPHWMVYLGNDMFGDQYGTRNAAAMAAFVPGRKIDTVYHTA